jgi:hypothetical protein
LHYRSATRAPQSLSEPGASSTATTVTVRGNVDAMKFLSDLIMSPLDQLHPLSRDTNALV